jgi:hypothetical protein
MIDINVFKTLFILGTFLLFGCGQKIQNEMEHIVTEPIEQTIPHAPKTSHNMPIMTLIYQNDSDDFRLYKMDVNGSNPTPLTDSRIYSLPTILNEVFENNEWIYHPAIVEKDGFMHDNAMFFVDNKHGSIYKTNMDNTHKVRIDPYLPDYNGKPLPSIQWTETYIYYIKWSDYHRNLCRIKYDGTDFMVLYEDFPIEFFYVEPTDSYIYYFLWDESEEDNGTYQVTISDNNVEKISTDIAQICGTVIMKNTLTEN